MAEAEKLWPHSSSVITLSLGVETPCTYISASAATSAFSLRWKALKRGGRELPITISGHPQFDLPIRVMSPRL
jgi:hypothetical protein